MATDTAEPHPRPSYYPQMLHDSAALYLQPPEYPVHGDGQGDDAPALQEAIDSIQEGIILIPSGTYRLAQTVYLWRGIRLIGYGPTRPRFVLTEETPGFQGERAYMIHFCDERSRTFPDGTPDLDARNTTFFSGVSNIDFEIQAGNPAAAALRFHVAQHSSVEHCDFFLDNESVGIEAVGNEIEDCRFYGGRLAISTHRTSPGWQWLLLDSEFRGQRVAAILTEEAGLTALRCRFETVPVGVAVHEQGVEELYMEDCTFRNVRDTALLFSVPDDPHNKINLRDIHCEHVPTFLRFRHRVEQVMAPAGRYVINELSQGLHVEGEAAQTKTVVDYGSLQELPDAPAPDYRLLPPQEAWVNVRDLGVAGDGETDDTAAFQKAVRAHECLYLPMGHYCLTDTLRLEPDTVLVGLHPSATRLVVEGDTPGFGDPDRPRAVLQAPPGGRNHITGIGLDPGRNKGAVGVLWQAGEESCLDDVWFAWGGHGVVRKVGEQLYSLWVANGGGGTFKNIWSPGVLARNGLYVSDTSTPARFYLLSIEHHRDVEVELERAANLTFYALQTEENLGSERAIALRIEECEGIEFMNLFLYRVMALRQRMPYAVEVEESEDVTILGAHCFSWGPFPFDELLLDRDTDRSYPQREVARLILPA